MHMSSTVHPSSEASEDFLPVLDADCVMTEEMQKREAWLQLSMAMDTEEGRERVLCILQQAEDTPAGFSLDELGAEYSARDQALAGLTATKMLVFRQSVGWVLGEKGKEFLAGLAGSV